MWALEQRGKDPIQTNQPNILIYNILCIIVQLFTCDTATALTRADKWSSVPNDESRQGSSA
jgi:hypothetical protein